ncbi:class I SAM-dependent methyltransferase [Pedobacter gandavensis]|uniref:class I SAM-dependent methyltransferase n=1 Tax=Pedobacter TaxID=84567 RepID=UPI001C9A1217|nr:MULTISPECIES: class I SAM-dependent methyltransferase [Pedobacter]WGQ09423.1 class I SAM-dependent methyltransferase [Pedobacter gandavensis]
MNTSPISDKIFWHKYINFYEELLPKEAKNVLEIGVFKGDSIRYWRERYPSANIFGLDIVEEIPSWPKDNHIKYFQADQSDAAGYHSILKSIGSQIDILIEDGSHDPLHQKISLIESLPYLTAGAIYILEDIHTAHPHHSYYKTRVKQFQGSSFSFGKKPENVFMPLQCLLLIEHLKTNGRTPSEVKNTIDFKNSLFTYEEVELLFSKIKTLKFYRRNVLPDFCFSCNTNNFDFTNLRCSCGEDLYLQPDSMSVVLMF